MDITDVTVAARAKLSEAAAGRLMDLVARI